MVRYGIVGNEYMLFRDILHSKIIEYRLGVKSEKPVNSFSNLRLN